MVQISVLIRRKVSSKTQKQRQLKLFEFETKTAFGGTLNLGRRKTVRPLDSARPVHLIFKADREDLLLANRDLVEQVLRRNGVRLGVKIRQVAVNADHIHIVIEFACRLVFTRWIRAVTGVLARKIEGLTWKQLPYTEIVNWGRHLKNTEYYLGQNQQEAEFILTRHQFVSSWREQMSLGGEILATS